MASKKKPKKTAAKGGTKRAAQKQQPLREQSVFSQFKREIWGGICALLALLIILSSLDKSSALAHFFMGMVGRIGLIVLPIGLVLCAIALFFHGGKPVTMRVLCSISFALLVSALAHLAIGKSEAVWGLDMFGVLYREGIENQSGGVLGGLLAMIFCLPGNRPVGWAVTILLLLVTLPASLNLTLTGLLRAINDHRDELRRQDKPERKEPAEVLVERAIQHRENREERRAEWRGNALSTIFPLTSPTTYLTPRRSGKRRRFPYSFRWSPQHRVLPAKTSVPILTSPWMIPCPLIPSLTTENPLT